MLLRQAVQQRAIQVGFGTEADHGKIGACQEGISIGDHRRRVLKTIRHQQDGPLVDARPWGWELADGVLHTIADGGQSVGRNAANNPAGVRRWSYEGVLAASVD